MESGGAPRYIKLAVKGVKTVDLPAESSGEESSSSAKTEVSAESSDQAEKKKKQKKGKKSDGDPDAKPKKHKLGIAKARLNFLGRWVPSDSVEDYVRDSRSAVMRCIRSVCQAVSGGWRPEAARGVRGRGTVGPGRTGARGLAGLERGARRPATGRWGE